MTREQLAALVLRVLDLQERAARSRHPDALRECRAAERRLREACEGILHPGQQQPGLFGDDGGG